MKSWKTPTPEQVKRAVAQLGHPEHCRYFFDKLENPAWVGPLRDEGLFRNPPAKVVNASDGSIRFPLWPESRYLARIAKSAPTDQQDVLVGVALGVPDTENFTVHSDLTQLALALPAA